ncbi:MAG: Unknown protein [uncultured Campylobacterales bacterium]|uniref:Bacterial toxin 33 domain-containing protein n=1 Tax=uncultured Campylobacterales bacterium TaxID=352960 RepID=A0A6S6SN93_9BACT|nr:MAG: Unknown protein [uncultured Campylobacterales bacterium]
MKIFLFFILSVTLLANTLNSTHNLDSQTHKVYSLGKPKNLPLFPLIHYGIRDFVPTLQNGNATPEQKQRAYTALVGYISEEMGVSGTQAKLMLSKNYKGFFSHENDNIYISDNQDTSAEVVETIGHEVSHYIDYTKDKDIDKTLEYKVNRENYADILGHSTLDYSNFNYTANGYNALDEVINRQRGSKASDLITQNNFEFNTLDKTKGDPYIEAGFETASISLGLDSFRKNIRDDQYGDAVIDALGLTIDGVLAYIPFIPGIAGLGIKSLRGDIKKISDNYLKQKGIDAHELKKDFLGKKANIAHYDLYVDKKTRNILIYRKKGKGEGIDTKIKLD